MSRENSDHFRSQEGSIVTIKAFASGTGKFHYEHPFATFGDIFAVAAIVGRLNSMANAAAGIKGAAGSMVNVAAKIAGGIYTSNTSPSPMADARKASLSALGLIAGTEKLSLAVDFMAMKFGEIQVKLVCRKIKIFGDDVRFGNALIDSMDGATTARMMRSFAPAMDKTSMNDYGALDAISVIFAEFTEKGGTSENGAMLNITLEQ